MESLWWTHPYPVSVRNPKDIKAVISEKKIFKTKDHESYLRHGLKPFLCGFSSLEAKSKDNKEQNERTDQKLGMQNAANKECCLLDLLR